MKQLHTTGIVLSRTDFGEADRIITVLTPDAGKLRLMARGVRRVKSRMAGGIELFSVSDITYILGRKEIGTLISTRLITHYGTIVQDIERVQLGYELIKILHKATEDQTEPEYFELLQQAFIALDDKSIPTDLIHAWFQAQLLKSAGHTPNLLTDTEGNELAADQTYTFDPDAVAFQPRPEGSYTADHIKLLRLLFSSNAPTVLNKIEGIHSLLPDIKMLINTQYRLHISHQ